MEYSVERNTGTETATQSWGHPEKMAKRRAVQRARRVGPEALSKDDLVTLNKYPDSDAAKKIRNRLNSYRPVRKNTGRSKHHVAINRVRF